MRGQALKDRRAKLAELALLDRQNRCAWCRMNLFGLAVVVQALGQPERYCSEGCRTDRLTYQAQRAERGIA